MALFPETQVLIAGAGPTGLLLAAGLARYGVTVRLIDQKPEPAQSSRAIGVFARTLEIFDDFGIAQDAIAHGLPIQGFNFHTDGRLSARIGLEARRTCFPNALSLLQSDTEALLTRLVEGLGVAVERSTTLIGIEPDTAGVTTTLVHSDGSEERCRTAWLVGCDGAGSTVRKEVGLPDSGKTLPAPFILADVEKPWPIAPAEAHIYLAADGVMALFPLPQENYWRIIASWPEETLPDNPERPLFEKLVEMRSPLSPQLSHIAWTSRFQVRQRMVSEARRGRVLVAGDALSSHSPLGGQGMNTGLQDAYNLAWKLALVLHHRASETLLDSYGAERLPISQKLLLGTGLATRLMLAKQSGLQQVRRWVPSAVSRLAPLRSLLIETVTELNVHYRNSPIVLPEPSLVRALLTNSAHPRAWLDFQKGPRVGERAPDVEVKTPQGPQRLAQLFSKALKHTLLLFAGTTKPHPLEHLSQAAQTLAAAFAEDIEVYLVLPSDQISDAAAWSGSPVLDPQGQCHRAYRAATECLYLIRPDGYIGYRSQSADSAIAPGPLQRYLQNLKAPKLGG